MFLALWEFLRYMWHATNVQMGKNVCIRWCHMKCPCQVKNYWLSYHYKENDHTTSTPTQTHTHTHTHTHTQRKRGALVWLNIFKYLSLYKSWIFLPQTFVCVVDDRNLCDKKTLTLNMYLSVVLWWTNSWTVPCAQPNTQNLMFIFFGFSLFLGAYCSNVVASIFVMYCHQSASNTV